MPPCVTFIRLFFNTLNASGKAEILLGSILKKNGWKRSSYIITTKIYWGGTTENEKGLSRKHIIEGLQYSLTRLGLDFVDIVFANRNDPNVPMEEIVRAFSYCIEKGMWRFINTEFLFQSTRFQ